MDLLTVREIAPKAYSNKNYAKRGTTIGCLDQYTAANSKYTGDECLPSPTNGDECHPQMQVGSPTPKMRYQCVDIQYTTVMAPFTNMAWL